MSLLPPRRGVPPLADDQSTADVPGLLPKRCIFPVLPERRWLARLVYGPSESRQEESRNSRGEGGEERAVSPHSS
jgi:hypothetical protein